MDWADDIAYSVHDLEDFHRVGVIPWWSILDGNQRDTLIAGACKSWFNAPVDAPRRMREALDRIDDLTFFYPAVTREVYDGSREQRNQLRNLTSQLIGRYVRAAKPASPESPECINIDARSTDEVLLLKYFARHYVIGLPALKAQQYGQQRIIRDLFDIFLSEGKSGNLDLFPRRLRFIWEDYVGAKNSRLAADCIATLTENEVYQLHRRLTGSDSGLVLDPIVR